MNLAISCLGEASKQTTLTQLPAVVSVASRGSVVMSEEEKSYLLHNIFTQDSASDSSLPSSPAPSSSANPYLFISILDEVRTIDSEDDDTSDVNVSVITNSSGCTTNLNVELASSPNILVRPFFCKGDAWCKDNCPKHTMCVVLSTDTVTGFCGFKKPCRLHRKIVLVENTDPVPTVSSVPAVTTITNLLELRARVTSTIIDNTAVFAITSVSKDNYLYSKEHIVVLCKPYIDKYTLLRSNLRKVVLSLRHLQSEINARGFVNKFHPPAMISGLQHLAPKGKLSPSIGAEANRRWAIYLESHELLIPQLVDLTAYLQIEYCNEIDRINADLFKFKTAHVTELTDHIRCVCNNGIDTLLFNSLQKRCFKYLKAVFDDLASKAAPLDSIPSESEDFDVASPTLPSVSPGLASSVSPIVASSHKKRSTPRGSSNTGGGIKRFVKASPIISPSIFSSFDIISQENKIALCKPIIRDHVRARSEIRVVDNNFYHNISNQILSEQENVILNNGLKFIYLPTDTTNQQFFDAFKNFSRNIRLKYHFLRSDNICKDSDLRISNPSYLPPPASDIIEHYLNAKFSDLSTILENYPVIHTNNRERLHVEKVVRNLLNKGLVIKATDKNLGPIVMTLSLYRIMCLEILNDNTTYIKLNATPTCSILFDNLYEILQRNGINPLNNSLLFDYFMQGSLNSKTKALASFYCLPKIHKVGHLKGRPIVSNTLYVTYFASKWLHKILYPLASSFASYIKDSSCVVLDLEQLTFSPSCVLMTIDVVSLYPSIPTALGLKALEIAMLSATFPSFKINFILELSEWVLSNTYINFENTRFLQIKGTAMGTPFAVVYSIIFLGIHEQSVLMKLNFKPLYFRRFIDDIFIILNSEQECVSFLSSFKDVAKNIDITSTRGDFINFLDISIFKGFKFHTQSCLDLKVFQKEHNKYLYIPPTSFHCANVFINLVKSELTRYCILCSSKSDFDTIKENFFKRLFARGYTRSFVESCIVDVSLDREALIFKLQEKRNLIAPISAAVIEPFMFIVPYSRRLINLKKLGWDSIPPYVFQDQFSSLIFNAKRPVIFAFKNSDNLAKIILNQDV